jgi:proton glutamate symport protein
LTAIIFVVCVLIISKMTGASLRKQFKAMYSTIMISIGTRSSFAALPNAIQGFTEGLGVSGTAVNSVLPLGISLCGFGNIMVYSLGSFFAIGLYNYQIGIVGLIMVLVGIILTAMAASGAPGLVASSMISMILAPLGLPAQAIIVMLIAIDPLIDPFATLANVYPNCAATAIISGGRINANKKAGSSLEQAQQPAGSLLP